MPNRNEDYDSFVLLYEQKCHELEYVRQHLASGGILVGSLKLIIKSKVKAYKDCAGLW